MGILNNNSTNYVHSNEPNTLSLHRAMDYNGLGQPILRTSIAGGGAGGTDAFGRLRVSNPETLFDTQNRYIDGEQFSTAASGSGSVTYEPNTSSFSLSVTGNGDQVVRQAKTVTLYQPGKSMLVLNTFVMDTPQENLRQRVGYFTEQNGIFLEVDGTNIYIVKRSYITGSVVDERIAQTDWNGEKLDGSNGISLDVSKAQIIWTDIEWLGVGSVRVGFVIDGAFHLCHTFNHANNISSVYMTTASLNCRYEITSTGASANMTQICSTVISEGGYLPTPPLKFTGNGTTETRLVTADTLYPLVSIRLDPSYPDSVVVPVSLSILTTSVVYGEVKIIEGATLTNASFSNVVSTVVEEDSAATAISGGTAVYESLFASRATVELSSVVSKRLQLAREADGTPITLTVAAAATSGNADVLYKFGWAELSN